MPSRWRVHPAGAPKKQRTGLTADLFGGNPETGLHGAAVGGAKAGSSCRNQSVAAETRFNQRFPIKSNTPTSGGEFAKCPRCVSPRTGVQTLSGISASKSRAAEFWSRNSHLWLYAEEPPLRIPSSRACAGSRGRAGAPDRPRKCSKRTFLAEIAEKGCTGRGRSRVGAARGEGAGSSCKDRGAVSRELFNQ